MKHTQQDQDQKPTGDAPVELPETLSGAAARRAADEDEEPRDLGFIVEDREDRRAEWLAGWERLDELDTNEPLETGRHGPLPRAGAGRRQGASQEQFGTESHVDSAAGEAQEAEFVKVSMLATDPEANAGVRELWEDTLRDLQGAPRATDLTGHAPGEPADLGTPLPQDVTGNGFSVRQRPRNPPESQ